MMMRRRRPLAGAAMVGGRTRTSSTVAGASGLADGHLFDDSEVWYRGDAIPPGTAASIALREHRWAIPFRDKTMEAGGVALADAWIHGRDLIAVGAMVGEAASGSAA
jgi:hypothetical protein